MRVRLTPRRVLPACVAATLLTVTAGCTDGPGLAKAASAYADPVAVYPEPGDQFEQPHTQITFRGIPASEIGTVTVTGSRSGVHTGQIEADSDGDGGSFVPTEPFDPDETVTVKTNLDVIDGKSGTFSFKIEDPAPALKAEVLPDATGPNSVQHFHTNPGLMPPAVHISKDAAPTSEGDIFVAPQYGPVENGPMILDSSGNLVWFDPYPIGRNELVTDFREQELNNQPVLTWFEGTTADGTGEGDGVIMNDEYQRIATVKAGNGLLMDLHEFLVTNSGDAYIVAVAPVELPGRSRPVLNSIVQEIDIKTGLVLFQWDALDHIPLTDSYEYAPSTSGQVLDPYHLNSVSLDANGNLVISMRNTNAVYDVNVVTGAVQWTLGGRHSSFKMGTGTRTAFQHDAVVQSNGDITIFDDGGGPPRLETNSRAIEIALNPTKNTATLVQQFYHSPQVQAAFEGSVQTLSDGDFFVGWGQYPDFSEYNAKGQQIFSGTFATGTASYRAYRFNWTGSPATAPSIVSGTSGAGNATVWTSWNGATNVTGYRVLGGNSPGNLTPLASYPKHHFESQLTPGTGDSYLRVQALGASGDVLSSTRVVPAPSHVQVFGGRAFVPLGGGLGSVPVGCYSARSCKLKATITAGGSVVAQTGSEGFAAGSGGLMYFRLSSAAQRLIDGGAHRLGVSIRVTDANGARGTTSGQILIGFHSSGSGPHRSTANESGLQILGNTDFVGADNHKGAILAQCRSVSPCKVSTTVAVGGKTVATAKPEYIGAEQLGDVYFVLDGTGAADLARAGGNQLGAKVSLTTAGGQTASADVALVKWS